MTVWSLGDLRLPDYTFPALTLGGASSEGAASWGEGLCWGWGCWGSVRAGFDDDGDDDEDGGWWWGSWLLRRWRFSKLGARGGGGSLKECDRDTTGGVAAAAAVEFEEATLTLLFNAARWERTLRTTRTHREGDGSVCMQSTLTKTGALWVSLGVCQVGAKQEPKTDPWGTPLITLQEHQHEALMWALFRHGIRVDNGIVHIPHCLIL